MPRTDDAALNAPTGNTCPMMDVNLDAEEDAGLSLALNASAGTLITCYVAEKFKQSETAVSLRCNPRISPRNHF